MNTRWLKGYKTPKEIEARKKEIMSYKNAFQELSLLLETEFEDGTPDYNSPSWAYHQADRNGGNRKLEEILRLIDIKD